MSATFSRVPGKGINLLDVANVIIITPKTTETIIIIITTISSFIGECCGHRKATGLGRHGTVR